MPHRIAQQLKAKARSLGFEVAGITAPNLLPENIANLEAFLSLGHHGEMSWMTEKADRRAAPTTLWPEAKSILMLGMNYGPPENPLPELEDPTRAYLSVYARNRDYHDVMKGRLKHLAQWLISTHGGAIKLFVDTAPVMEKPLAEQAGIGWRGKHTCIVSRQYGSWLFLAALFTTHALPPDEPETDHCGSCTACLTICPTQAFTAARQLDARRCISYLTIEHKSPIPREFRRPMGNRVYGCDDCLAICPWNKFAQTAQEQAFHARQALQSPDLATLLQLDDPAFRTLFSASPVKRIGHARFLRNLLIAAGNSQNPGLTPHILPHLTHESPLVRGMAVWALAELLPKSELPQHRPSKESDPHVLQEWESALS